MSFYFRHAHQVTLLALHQLRKEAFSVSAKDGATFEEWSAAIKQRSPTFLFWELIIKYETLVLMFVRAHRERNFSLFVEVLEAFVPLFFALDHINYSRWVPIHLRDMKTLPESIRKEFQEENHWVISKTGNKFSSMPIDQAHEQANKMVKGCGGAVGLTENPVAFRYVSAYNLVTFINDILILFSITGDGCCPDQNSQELCNTSKMSSSK